MLSMGAAQNCCSSEACTRYCDVGAIGASARLPEVVVPLSNIGAEVDTKGAAAKCVESGVVRETACFTALLSSNTSSHYAQCMRGIEVTHSGYLRISDVAANITARQHNRIAAEDEQLEDGDCILGIGDENLDAAAMSLRLQQGGELMLRIVRPYRFVVKGLDTSMGELGLRVIHRLESTAIYITEVLEHGLVGLHNDASPELQILAGDLIVQVNSRRGKAPALLKLLADEAVVDLTIDRPSDTVTLL